VILTFEFSLYLRNQKELEQAKHRLHELKLVEHNVAQLRQLGLETSQLEQKYQARQTEKFHHDDYEAYSDDEYYDEDVYSSDEGKRGSSSTWKN
jgi:hypothetical protein